MDAGDLTWPLCMLNKHSTNWGHWATSLTLLIVALVALELTVWSMFETGSIYSRLAWNTLCSPE